MGVLFSHRHVTIHGYSRLVLKSKKITAEKFFAGMNRKFSVTAISGIDPCSYQIIVRDLYHPHHVFHMYIGGIWYECSIPANENADPIESLDVSVLQRKCSKEFLVSPIPGEIPVSSTWAEPARYAISKKW